VSVCTPTWQRHDLLLDRCIASVQAQDYEAVEHVIVSDGPDAVLRTALELYARQGFRHPVRFHELPGHHPEPNFGHYARMAAVGLARGDYIAYNDDDDFLRPGHCRLLAAALNVNPDAGFALSRMAQWQRGSVAAVIGIPPLGAGNLGTTMIMHRRETLDHGTWGPPARLEDWELAEKWLVAGVRYVSVDAVTSDVYPSVFR
jgi:glycosyltransferase involved in cell wall biosynthesis